MQLPPSPIIEIHDPLLTEKSIQLFVKRDDLVHPSIIGNKWRKLKYNILEAKQQKKKSILTMGGAFSNHIHATAAAGKEFGFKTIGIIRGEELDSSSNETLAFARQMGMELSFVDRKSFKSFRKNPHQLIQSYPESYFLPEGGTNTHAIEGCKEIVKEIEIDFDVIAAPIGTGGTLCGLVNGVKDHQSVLGISSLKGEFIKDEIEALKNEFRISKENYQVLTNYHFGGYGKTNQQLIDFINWFKENFSMQLDPIYTGKCFFAVWDMIKRNKFENNLKIVILHTGGLQGIEGFNRKNENIIQ